MHQRTCTPVWRRLGSPFLALSLLLGACSGPLLPRSASYLPPQESGPWVEKAPTEKELLLARSDFSMELVRFVDARRPRSMELQTPDQTIYQYDPDDLMQGVTYRLPALMEKYMAYRPRMAKHYKVEMELKELNTAIKTGDWWSGTWGRYATRVELVALVRRPDSTVVLQRHYRVNFEQPRDSLDGRSPSKERDRARMYDQIDAAIRKISENIAWDVRQGDARVWDVERNPTPGMKLIRKPSLDKPMMVPATPVNEPRLPDDHAPASHDFKQG